MAGGPGEVPHFYAVASYGVQHPESMSYTIEVLAALRASLRDVLDGTRTLDDIRRAARYEAAKAGRVTRRDGDRIPTWPVRDWPLTVLDVLDAGPLEYQRSVEGWARSVVQRLEHAEPTA